MEDGEGDGSRGWRHGEGERMRPGFQVGPCRNRNSEAALLYDGRLHGRAPTRLPPAKGFSPAELVAAVREAHARGVRVYYCLNALPYDAHLPAVEEALERLSREQDDGLITADPGVNALRRQRSPSVPLHLSTQAHSRRRRRRRLLARGGDRPGESGARTLFQGHARAGGSIPRIWNSRRWCTGKVSGPVRPLSASAWVNGRPANQGALHAAVPFRLPGLRAGGGGAGTRGRAFVGSSAGRGLHGLLGPARICACCATWAVFCRQWHRRPEA
ncbi:MAG: U32 family peptidase [Bilophila sp.]